MKNKKDIDPKNSKGQWHGYHEWYMCDKIWVRATFKNGTEIGYKETHQYMITYFFIR